MDLLEFQARELFQTWGIAVPNALVANDANEVAQAATQLGGSVVVKAQVPAGGRGKSGGVVVAATAEDARTAAERILQHQVSGHRVECLLVAEAVAIARECYAAVLLDRDAEQYRALFCAAGGVDIETIAQQTPDALLQLGIDPDTGFDLAAANAFLEPAGLEPSVNQLVAEVLVRCYTLLREADATLVEINPLAETADGDVIALDAKVTLDDSAAFRHPERAELYANAHHRDPIEHAAFAAGLNYVKLDGQVGIIGNGAGLVLSTLDIVTDAGAEANIRPANFLDIGGGASSDTMVEALRAVMSDPQVRCVFVNIFGGITACDTIATGMAEAIERIGAMTPAGQATDLPIVVRFDGNAADAGRAYLRELAHPQITLCDTMEEAAQTAVAHAAGGAQEA